MRGLASILLLMSVLVVTPNLASGEGTRLKGPKGVDYGEQGRSFGPVKESDTLWRIAVKIRPDNSVSIYQVMQALYEKNPDSFLDKNINHIRDGAYLKIPSLAEIRSIEPELARQKSDKDDAMWEKKKNGTLDSSTINLVEKKMTQARQSDVEDAKQEIKKELDELKQDQSVRLVDLQKKFKESVDNVETILAENNKLKSQLENISSELDGVKEQLGNDSLIQQQLREMLSMQNELLAQQKAEMLEKEAGFSWSKFISDPLTWIFLGSVPAIMMLVGGYLYIRNRKAAAQEPENIFDTPKPAVAPAPPPPPFETDSPDLMSMDDSLADDTLDDLLNDSIQLDDVHDNDDMLPEPDDILYEEDEPELDLDDFEGDSLLNQDELDGLLSDDLIFDDGSDELDDLVPDLESDAIDPNNILNEDDIDALLQQDFDSDDDLLPETDIEIDIPEELEPDDNVVDDVDIDGIMDELSASNTPVKDDDIDSLLEGNQQDDSDDLTSDLDDIDDLLNSVQADEALDNADIDDLLDSQPMTEQAIDDLLASDDDTLLDNDLPTSDADELGDDFDDIDSLLDAVNDTEKNKPSSVPSVDLSNDDLDDIDSILDAIDEAPSTEPDIEINIDGDNETNDLTDDLDSLLDTANDELDDILDSTDEASSVSSDIEINIDSNNEVNGITDDFEDLDSLLDTTNDALVDDLDDLDGLLDGNNDLIADPELTDIV
ncbi:FimV/HubP family polar landmark protein, partial [Pseudoalteromonas tunicata]|uniref:FimV/HubP family polar landmark protein n=1 Tax=Pseudoalteromonas tunicata TaxID=314281 RepID=UPI00273D5D27